MLAALRQALQEAVENFQAELALPPSEASTSASLETGSPAWAQALSLGRGTLERLTAESERALEALGAQQAALEDCLRIASKAQSSGDTKTQRLAESFAALHRERMELLSARLELLRKEFVLETRQLSELANLETEPAG
jgi:hypothetical protein